MQLILAFNNHQIQSDYFINILKTFYFNMFKGLLFPIILVRLTIGIFIILLIFWSNQFDNIIL